MNDISGAISSGFLFLAGILLTFFGDGDWPSLLGVLIALIAFFPLILITWNWYRRNLFFSSDQDNNNGGKS